MFGCVGHVCVGVSVLYVCPLCVLVCWRWRVRLVGQVVGYGLRFKHGFGSFPLLVFWFHDGVCWTCVLV